MALLRIDITSGRSPAWQATCRWSDFVGLGGRRTKLPERDRVQCALGGRTRDTSLI